MSYEEYKKFWRGTYILVDDHYVFLFAASENVVEIIVNKAPEGAKE